LRQNRCCKNIPTPAPVAAGQDRKRKESAGQREGKRDKNSGRPAGRWGMCRALQRSRRTSCTTNTHTPSTSINKNHSTILAMYVFISRCHAHLVCKARDGEERRGKGETRESRESLSKGPQPKKLKEDTEYTHRKRTGLRCWHGCLRQRSRRGSP